ncbi:VOC family protein [soil metagenome]
MATKIFINLAVKDLVKTKEFFSKLGYTYNEQFTNDAGACMVISEDIYVMLLTEPFFKGFITKEIVDSKKATEVLLCLSADSREDVDTLVNKAVEAGGKAAPNKQEHGEYMYGWGYEDIDGHHWEVMWMDMSLVPADLAKNSNP